MHSLERMYAKIHYVFDDHMMWFWARTAPEVPSATALLQPGVDHADQLYLPSTPGTLKSGAPPQAGFERNYNIL